MADEFTVKMVVGLGNPGAAYKGTRHNVGFEVVDRLAEQGGARWRRSLRTAAQTSRVKLVDEELFLVKPLTFMNRSGEAVRSLLRRRALTVADLIVVVDDIDLATGRIRVRPRGSAGGHNGLKSIIQEIGSDQFVRIRVGVGGKPDGGDLVDHVLSTFTGEERSRVREAVARAVEALAWMVRAGVESAMNQFNGSGSEGDQRE